MRPFFSHAHTHLRDSVKKRKASVVAGSDFESAIFCRRRFLLQNAPQKRAVAQNRRQRLHVLKQPKKVLTSAHDTRCIHVYGSRLSETLASLLCTHFSLQQGGRDCKYANNGFLLVPSHLRLQHFHRLPRRSLCALHSPAQEFLYVQRKKVKLFSELFGKKKSPHDH